MTIDYDKTMTISIQVMDWERATRWYQEVLEFKLIYDVPDMGWCELESGVPGTTIGLSKVDHLQPADVITPILGVKDIDAARRELEARGVRFIGETTTIPDLVRLASFTDPEGNILRLAQSLAGN
jgi:predicted enzyme related to lactoylglutathione lyase